MSGEVRRVPLGMTSYRWTSPTSPVYTAPPSRWRQAARRLGVAAVRLTRVLALLAAFEVALLFRAGVQ